MIEVNKSAEDRMNNNTNRRWTGVDKSGQHSLMALSSKGKWNEVMTIR